MNIALGKNKKKRVVRVAIEVLDTISGKEGKNEDKLDLFVYDKNIVMNQPEVPFSGTIDMPHRGGHEFNGDILIRQDLPLPMTILSLLVEVEVY